jgi:hypothetical protein
MKKTIEVLKTIATKVYPPAIKEVKAVKYKFPNKSGYYLLDNATADADGNTVVPKIFWDRGKWRQTSVFLEALKRHTGKEATNER